MDEKIWSRLPVELLVPIMQYANAGGLSESKRRASWQKWLTVVRGNNFLHKALLSQQWETLRINWSDLVLDPGEGEAELQKSAPDLKGQVIRKLLVTLEANRSAGVTQQMLQMDSGLCPGNFVQNLLLQLDQDIDILDDYAPISHRMIRHTLSLMTPALKRVKFVNVDGPPSMATFQTLSEIGSRTLQKLHIGSTWCDHNYITAPGDEYLNKYDWTKLSGLANLTELIAMQLTEDDVPSLHRMIRGLPSLRRLGLAPRRTDLDDWSNRQGRQSPFQKLLGSKEVLEDDSRSKFLPNLLAVLPSTLVTLILQDPFHKGAFRLRVPAPSEYQDHDLSKCVLDELLTELDDYESTNNTLRWLTSAKLTRITYSPVVSLDTPADFDSLSESLDSINDIVSRHQNTLTEINMTNAWKMHQDFADHFTTIWSHNFRIYEVVLATDCVRAPECTLAHKEGQTQDLKHFLYGCSENVNRWGNDIRRIRLHVPLSPHDIDLKADDLMSYPSLKKLRVLIIGSRSVCLPQRKDEKTHRDIAEALLAHAPDTLRFIRLCHHEFWVQYDNSDIQNATSETEKQTAVESTKLRRRLVSWKQALADDYESEPHLKSDKNNIGAWLSIRDREFLDDDSKSRRRNNIPRRISQSELDLYWLQPFNSLVARLTGTES